MSSTSLSTSLSNSQHLNSEKGIIVHTFDPCITILVESEPILVLAVLIHYFRQTLKESHCIFARHVLDLLSFSLLQLPPSLFVVHLTCKADAAPVFLNR